ncbi:MAG: MlaD family protein [Phycisphaerae bacterium]|nr:MlaD family protein [Phycisphaerae bacterium]MDW8261747.1 MlaD family protein [Phycisphaerales bacterium]
MNKERNAVYAGIFMLASAALIIAVIIGIKGLGALALPHNQYTAVFSLSDNVGGLRVGDDVRVGGVKLGTVRSIEYVPARQGAEPSIRVRFRLPRYVALTSDARVVVETGVTGTSNLNIDNIRPGGAALPDNAEIRGQQGGLTALLAALSDAGPNVSGLIGDLRGQTVPKVNAAVDEYKALASELRAKVEPVYRKYDQLTDRGSEALSEVRDVFGESKGDFRTTIANLSAATTDLRQKLGPILEKVDGGLEKAQTALTSLNATLEDVKKVGDNTRDITANVRAIVNNNRGRIESMLASLKATSDNLKGATSELRRAPWRILWKPSSVDQANQSLFDSARQFADGASNLNDAAKALRDALNNPQVTPEQIQQLLDQLDASFRKFNRIEAQLWEQVKD